MNTSRNEDAFRCSFCARVFSRIGHRKRHELSHTACSEHQCSICNKRFLRRDALQRHERTHQTASTDALRRISKACSGCASARVKCSGGELCDRCVQRGENCTYSVDEPLQRVTAIPSSPLASVPDLDQTRGSSPNVDFIENLQFETCDGNHSYPASLFSHSFPAATNWIDATTDLDEMVLQHAYFPDQVPATSIIPPTPYLASNFGDSITSTSSHGDSSRDIHTTATMGKFYVDGKQARLPKAGRCRPRVSIKYNLRQPGNAFSLKEPSIMPAAKTDLTLIEPEQYKTLADAYERLCLGDIDLSRSFQSSPFVSQSCLEALIQLSLDRCHAMLPFLHTSSFTSSKLHWRLGLAIAALGARYIEGPCGLDFAMSLHEFQRRVERSIKDSGWPEDCCEPYQQYTALLLYYINTADMDCMLLSQVITELQKDLSNLFCKAIAEASALSLSNTEVVDNESWLRWKNHESCIRIAYFAWQLDCMWAYHHHTRPLLGLLDVNVILPCHDSLWNTANCSDWIAIIATQPNLLIQPHTLSRSLQQIYINRSTPCELGSFARVLIIHAIIHRSWEVERYFSNPLSQWEPVAAHQDSGKVLGDDVWLPDVPTFVRWQNSTCDVLDILHWKEHAVIAQADGFEPPTVLHLHVARIICLAPYTSIVTLARLLTASIRSGSSTTMDHQIKTETEIVRKWAVKHQYKARLSVVHSGALLWHARRFSIDAFYEGPAVALAALTLWAFSSFADRSLSTPRQELEHSSAVDDLPAKSGIESDDSLEGHCDIILLDRPIDDELVQKFIRIGDTMEAHLCGVGNLYAAKGPMLILSESCKLLAQSEKFWFAARQWRELLTKLATLFKK